MESSLDVTLLQHSSEAVEDDVWKVYKRANKKPSFLFWKEGVKLKVWCGTKALRSAYVRQQTISPRPVIESADIRCLNRTDVIYSQVWYLSRVRDVINSYLLLYHILMSFLIVINVLLSASCALMHALCSAKIRINFETTKEMRGILDFLVCNS